MPDTTCTKATDSPCPLKTFLPSPGRKMSMKQWDGARTGRPRYSRSTASQRRAGNCWGHSSTHGTRPRPQPTSDKRAVSKHCYQLSLPERMENREENSPSWKLGNNQSPKAQLLGCNCCLSQDRGDREWPSASPALGWCVVLQKLVHVPTGHRECGSDEGAS